MQPSYDLPCGLVEGARGGPLRIQFALARDSELGTHPESRFLSLTPACLSIACHTRFSLPFCFSFFFSREAAKECRRRKKEYVKCLESRVAVLEVQNKKLIEELETLKDFCSPKAD